MKKLFGLSEFVEPWKEMMISQQEAMDARTIASIAAYLWDGETESSAKRAVANGFHLLRMSRQAMRLNSEIPKGTNDAGR